MGDADNVTKKPLKDRFERAPFIKYEKGQDSGLVGFNRALTDEDLEFIKQNIKTLNGKDVVWNYAEGEQ